MMMRSSATVNTAQEEYKYCWSTCPLCTQNSPSTLLRFRDKMICRENRNNVDTGNVKRLKIVNSLGKSTGFQANAFCHQEK